MRALSSKKSSILSRIKTRDFQSSTKIEALREEVHKMLQADPSAKAIVFSQFTSMLDLVSFRLEQVQQSKKSDTDRDVFGQQQKELYHMHAESCVLQTGTGTATKGNQSSQKYSNSKDAKASSVCWILQPSDWSRYIKQRKPILEEILKETNSYDSTKPMHDLHAASCVLQTAADPAHICMLEQSNHTSAC